MGVLESDEAAEDVSIYHYSAALDEDGGGGLVWAVVTEEVEDMQKYFKSSSLSLFMLKPSHLLT